MLEGKRVQLFIGHWKYKKMHNIKIGYCTYRENATFTEGCSRAALVDDDPAAVNEGAAGADVFGVPALPALGLHEPPIDVVFAWGGRRRKKHSIRGIGALRLR